MLPRRLVLLLLLSGLACTAGETDDHPRIVLPAVGAVGATPAELGLDHVVVTVMRSGRILTSEGEKAPADLVPWFLPQADRVRDDSLPQRISHVHLLVRADAGAPWAAVQGVLRAAMDPVIRMNRVLFAVRLEQTREVVEGAFAYFLPLDSGLGADHAPDEPLVLLKVKRDETAGYVLMMVDWLHRSGHRPWIVPASQSDLMMEAESGEFESVNPMDIKGPWAPPSRSADLAGIPVLQEMVVPVLTD